MERSVSGTSAKNPDLALLSMALAELRRIAIAKMAKEKPGATLQPTALVHEPDDSGSYTVRVQNEAGETESASVLVRVAPPPTLQIQGRRSASLVFAVPTCSEVIYGIEYTNQLEPATWQTLREFPGTDDAITFEESLSEQPRRFYRMLAR